MRPSLAMVAAAMLAMVSPALAQETTADARADGKAMAEAFRQDGTLVPNTEGQAFGVPGYQGTTLPQSDYFDDPDRMVSEASAQTSSNEGYSTVIEGDRVRPRFDTDEVKGSLARASEIEENPDLYLEGQSITTGQSTCTALPPGSGELGYFEATCNSGSELVEETRSCSPRIVTETVSTQVFKYYVAGDGVYGAPFPRDNSFAAGLTNGTCTVSGAPIYGCTASRNVGLNPNKFCDDYYVRQISCTAEITGTGPVMPRTGKHWYAQEGENKVETRIDEGACSALAGNSMCSRQIEICTAGTETRIIDGVPITQPCWEWRREYLCQTARPANDCNALQANSQCTYVRKDCLDDDDGVPDGACQVWDHVYRCPVPAGESGGDKQYICGDDVYCINGECETIEREASTELKDALVALHAIGQAGEEFNPGELTVFSGERDTCHKPVFGLINCCAGKASGLLTVGAGAAALAGGPAAIAAVATPFLTLFACSTSEKMLDIKDRMGFCHKVGTYCSSKFLGICKTKRTAYCCFESKLSRILQEQGRIQLNKPWGKPKTEQCRGFSIDEFSRLDLSKMDFTEVYAEFIDAAKLPDEVQTMSDIQKKIEEYYARSAPGGG